MVSVWPLVKPTMPPQPVVAVSPVVSILPSKTQPSMATTDYNVTIDASIECGNLFACQFHPEKSGSVGLAILENFIRL